MSNDQGPLAVENLQFHALLIASDRLFVSHMITLVQATLSTFQSVLIVETTDVQLPLFVTIIIMTSTGLVVPTNTKTVIVQEAVATPAAVTSAPLATTAAWIVSATVPVVTCRSRILAPATSTASATVAA